MLKRPSYDARVSDPSSSATLDSVLIMFFSGETAIEDIAMDILLPGPGCRVPGLDFDADGPKIDGAHLLAKSSQGFVPRAREKLDEILRKRVEGPFESKHMHERLAAIARAMNAGDIALAAIATSQLQLRRRPTLDRDAAGLRKAGVDDPVHPGWPAGSSDGRGGKFRPHDSGGPAASVAAAAATLAADRLARIERLQARRSIRAVLLKFLSPRRLARLGLELGGEAIPGFDVVDSALLAEDIAEIASGVMENSVEVDAALAFVRQGPRAIEELTMSAEDEAFPTFWDFKKLELDKQFGEAGDGYEYHHIVEQSSGLPLDELNSTSNIVPIPKLLHEEVNAAFSRYDELLGTSLRQSLAGTSFETRRAAGLDVLRKLGIIQP